jgi:hypothetical protein
MRLIRNLLRNRARGAVVIAIAGMPNLLPGRGCCH